MSTQNSNAVVAEPQDRIRKEVAYKPLVISRLYQSNYQKEGTQTAEIKQTVETRTFYPSKSVSSDLQDNPFATEDFGFEESHYDNSEVRVAWIDVPLTATEVTVKAALAKKPQSRLYKILSNHPILSDRQKYAIENATTTLEIVADRQAVRYPATHETSPSQLIMDQNGKPQYRGIFFKETSVDDVDRRTEEPSDFYATATMQEEMTGIISQTMTSI